MLIPIVDLEDTIIAYKGREDVDYSKDIFRTASLWIINSHGDVLLAQRKFNKKVDPGKWAEAVGGTVEGTDTYEATIMREAAEELGLIEIRIAKGPKQLITTPCRYFVQWYTTTVEKDVSELIIQTEEIEQVAWVPHEQLTRELEELPGKYIEAMRSIMNLFVPEKN